MACLPSTRLVPPLSQPSPPLRGVHKPTVLEMPDSCLGLSLCQQPKEMQQVHSLRIPV